MNFKCVVCKRTLTVSCDENPVYGDMLMRPWYKDANGLNHHALLCLKCFAVHDTAGSIARFLLQKFIERPLLVHAAIRPLNNGEAVEISAGDGSSSLITDKNRADAIINSFPDDILVLLRSKNILPKLSMTSWSEEYQ